MRLDMNPFLFILGIFWLLLGVTTILLTKKIKRYYKLFIEQNHPKAMGALAVFVGGLLISVEVNSGLYYLVFVLGVIQITKGLYLLFAPYAAVQKLFKWWFGASLVIYRIWGLVTIAMGLILLKAGI